MNDFPDLSTIFEKYPTTILYPQIDQFLELSLPLQNFISIYLPKLHLSNSGALLSHLSKQQKFISKLSPKSISILPFKPSAKIEFVSKKNGWQVLANPSKLSRSLEDKLNFSMLAGGILPLIPHQIGQLSADFFAKAQKEYGQKLVIQTHFGWAGKSTYTFDSYTQASATILPQTTVKIMPYYRGITYITNNCITRWGQILGTPGLQIDNLPQYSTNPFATVGRQWPSYLPKSMENKLNSLNSQVALFLKKFSFRGFYGVDYLLFQDQFYVLEINPRLTASTNFYNHLELGLNHPTTLYWHIAEFLNIDLNRSKFDFSPYTSVTLSGCELTPKNHLGQTVSKTWLQSPPNTSFPPKYYF